MTQQYYELSIKPRSEYALFLDFITDIYKDAIEESGGAIILRDEEPLEEIKWGVGEFQNALQKRLKKDIEVEMHSEKKENSDWIDIYQKSIQPIEIYPFYIRTSWHEPKESLTNIIIDPALAFGSGHHESTHSCIEIINTLDIKNKKTLDVGCGSGILSIVASLNGAEIYLCDSDSLSIEESVKNLKLNGIKKYEIKEGSAHSFSEEFDAVFANISADILVAISHNLKKRVKDGGYLIASGIIKDKIDSVKECYNEFSIEKSIQLNDWYTLLLKKG
ncbi:MAG: 50S ribosomal protein L11 methyltransferase [Campylobacterales bacterium]